MKNQEIQLRAFGVLRKIADEKGWIRFQCEDAPGPFNVKTLKKILKAHIQSQGSVIDPEVIDLCAVANENDVLGEDAVLTSLSNLAILPPVSGG